MSKGFGRRRGQPTRPALATYEERLARKSRMRQDYAIDKAFAWVAFFTAVFCALAVLAPEAVVAAVCSFAADAC